MCMKRIICKENRFFKFDKPKEIDLKQVIKLFLYPFLSLFYKLLFVFQTRDKRRCAYSLSVCSIFKNEAPYLREWIEYHLIVGVEHFYLYNNNSEDNFEEVLRPYIEKGLVTLTDWPEYPGQVKAYRHWYDNYRFDSNWVALIDLDEFICPRSDNNINDFLKKYKYPVVVGYWRFFGTSGKLDVSPDQPLIEQLTGCYEKLINMGKVFYNTRYDIDSFEKGMMHICYARFKGFRIPPVNEQEKYIIWDIHHFKSKPLSLQINHYWSRNYSAYCKKKNRGGGMSGKWVTDEIFWRNEHNNTTKDYTIFKYLLNLKLKLTEVINQDIPV